MIACPSQLQAQVLSRSDFFMLQSFPASLQKVGTLWLLKLRLERHLGFSSTMEAGRRYMTRFWHVKDKRLHKLITPFNEVN